jgi:hypothetical protein
MVGGTRAPLICCKCRPPDNIVPSSCRWIVMRSSSLVDLVCPSSLRPYIRLDIAILMSGREEQVGPLDFLENSSRLTDRIPNADYNLYSTDDCKRIINNLGREPTSFTTFTNTQEWISRSPTCQGSPPKNRLGEAGRLRILTV